MLYIKYLLGHVAKNTCFVTYHIFLNSLEIELYLPVFPSYLDDLWEPGTFWSDFYILREELREICDNGGKMY